MPPLAVPRNSLELYRQQRQVHSLQALLTFAQHLFPVLLLLLSLPLLWFRAEKGQQGEQAVVAVLEVAVAAAFVAFVASAAYGAFAVAVVAVVVAVMRAYQVAREAS